MQLNNQLQNAFKDLEEDEDADYTMNSTKNSNGNSYHNNSKGNHQQYQPQQPFPLRNGETQLKNLLESKSREVEYVTSQLMSEREKHKAALDEYKKRLSIAEAEKERALMTREQTHELLVENKSKVIEMEEINQKLQSKIKSLETENSNIIGELEATKLMLSDVQIKYNMVEKNVKFTADRNTDVILKQAQERHKAQVEMMQQQMDGLKAKYDDLEHDHKNLEIRYKELQRSRERMLIEKSETINQLNKNLEDAQRQCQELLSRPNYSQENRQLQAIIRSMETQKEEMNAAINKLQRRLQEQTSEMELMDSIVQECGGNNISFSESSKFINRDPLKNRNSTIPLAPEARLARVKEELCKSLNNIKNKREEIKIIEKQLKEKDDEIKKLKMDENKALVQMKHYRDETIRLESKTKILEKELDKMRRELQESLISNKSNCITDEKYEEKIRDLENQNQFLEDEMNSIKQDYERLIMKNAELTENEKEWQERMERMEEDLRSVQDSSHVLEDLKKEREKIQALEEKLQELKSIEKVDRATQNEGKKLSFNNLLTISLFTIFFLFSLIEKSLSKVSESCSSCNEHLMKLEEVKKKVTNIVKFYK